ncbi:MAG: 1-acyl-sn-glycerol-3-phosphate acyltransferase [Ruminococcaceae bacterium]|nr:1-acyl-sn-glycerol-3-phosphate acyltransferase [Oscillospiraceae bacterium]
MLFKIIKFLIKCFLHVFFRLKVHNIENFPKEGGTIVAINHKSNWDAVFCVALLPRRIFFMAKQELFSKPLLGKIVKWAGAFPVNRGTADVGAIKNAIKILKNGECMAIFPEGTRVREGEPHEIKSGVAMIAEKTKAPVVPVAIKGKYGIFRKIEIFVGEPVYVKSEDGSKLSHEEIYEFSRQIMYGVLKMAGENVEGLSC